MTMKLDDITRKRWNADEAKAKERDTLSELVGAAYQIVGILADHAGLSDHPAVVRALDAFSEQRETEPLFPWPHEPLGDALAARAEGNCIHWLPIADRPDEWSDGRDLLGCDIDGKIESGSFEGECFSICGGYAKMNDLAYVAEISSPTKAHGEG